MRVYMSPALKRAARFKTGQVLLYRQVILTYTGVVYGSCSILCGKNVPPIVFAICFNILSFRDYLPLEPRKHQLCGVFYYSAGTVYIQYMSSMDS